MAGGWIYKGNNNGWITRRSIRLSADWLCTWERKEKSVPSSSIHQLGALQREPNHSVLSSRPLRWIRFYDWTLPAHAVRHLFVSFLVVAPSIPGSCCYRRDFTDLSMAADEMAQPVFCGRIRPAVKCLRRAANKLTQGVVSPPFFSLNSSYDYLFFFSSLVHYLISFYVSGKLKRQKKCGPTCRIQPNGRQAHPPKEKTREPHKERRGLTEKENRLGDGHQTKTFCCIIPGS